MSQCGYLRTTSFNQSQTYTQHAVKLRAHIFMSGTHDTSFNVLHMTKSHAESYYTVLCETQEDLHYDFEILLHFNIGLVAKSSS